MLRNRNHLAEQYFADDFRYESVVSGSVPESRFKAVKQQFSLKYDDFYHDYFRRYGKQVEANIALVSIAFELFRSVYGHLPLAYKNCAISSGTWSHHDAVLRDYHTTDRLSRVVGSDWHAKTIKDNSQRSLERIERVKDLFIEVFFIAPTMFEGSTRVFSKEVGRQLTSIPFQAEEYMAFWNMIIDSCEAFVLDDVRLDTPDVERVGRELEMAQSGRTVLLDSRPILQTSDWANSRNSVYEMARGNYIRFGLHPLRPDAKMDMRLYDQGTNRLYHARLIDTLKPVLQSILRWAPQGIAVDSAVITAVRLMDIHRMRIDRDYNSRQIAPLDLDAIDKRLAKPTRAETQEFEGIVKKFEPFLLEYLPHLIRPEGLPDVYTKAKKEHPIQKEDVGQKSLLWQRENIPRNLCLDLWGLTEPTPSNPAKACKVSPVTHGAYLPQRRLHDFDNHPFLAHEEEIWPDDPYQKLDPMFRQLAKAHIGVLEIVAVNANAPEFKGVYCDLKRGDLALRAAKNTGMSDLANLPGALGRKFADQVRDQNLVKAMDRLEQARHTTIGKKERQIPAFGTASIAGLNAMVNSYRPKFNGPGPNAAPSDYRLALMMEMLKRNLSVIEFEKNWEVSEDASRLMLLATKIEFGLIKRPGGNDTELKVVDENCDYIPFAVRIERLHSYLSRLKVDPAIKRIVETRDAEALEGYGIRHISLTLARLLEIYDCLLDQDYNNNRFELRRVKNLQKFTAGLHAIGEIKDEAFRDIIKEWCWMWDKADFRGLRQEYRDSWSNSRGTQSRLTGVPPDSSVVVTNRYGPR